jgi:hypothetical protein
VTAAITFDVDGLQRDPFVSEPTPAQRLQLHDVAHEIVLPRIARWLRDADVRATFFSIGADVCRSPRIYQQLAADGHEIANHTHSHPRDFSRQPATVIRDEIREAHAAIRQHAGVDAVGFRSPGYTVTPAVIEALSDLGYRYDASVFPSWSYITLKRAYQWFGGSRYRQYLVVQSYRCAAAPPLPYPVSAPDIFRRSTATTLTEIPLTALGPLQFPFVHGMTFMLPRRLRQAALAAALRRRFFTLSFHDLEFADRSDFGSLPSSAMTTRHLLRPIEERLEELTAAIAQTRQTHRFVTMRQAAESID